VLDRRKDGQAESPLGPLGEDDVVLGLSTRPGRVRFKYPSHPDLSPTIWPSSFHT